jgi:hypothetical protein
VIAEGAFEDCCLLTTIDFRSWKQLQEICGNSCAGLHKLTFEEEPGVGEVEQLPGRSSLKRLAGFARCPVETIKLPLRTKVIEAGAFKDCRCLVAVNVFSCRSLKEIHGFSECPLIRRVMVPVSLKSLFYSFNPLSTARKRLWQEKSIVTGEKWLNGRVPI